MAKEDFCFTFYDGDAARDASHMNRTERGGYYDMIIAQRKFGWLTIDQIKKVLGKDFEEIWPAIELIMTKEGDLFYIGWVETSIQKSRKHSGHQSENGKKGGRPPKNKPNEKPNESQPKADDNPNLSQKKPLGNGYGNEDVFGLKDEGVGETNQGLIVPEMLQVFKDSNPEYLFDQRLDPEAAYELSVKVHKFEKLPGQPTDFLNLERIKTRWGECVLHIKADSHYSTYSLTQINKYFQGILQSLTNKKNGTNKQNIVGGDGKGGGNGKLGTSAARIDAAKKW